MQGKLSTTGLKVGAVTATNIQWDTNRELLVEVGIPLKTPKNLHKTPEEDTTHEPRLSPCQRRDPDTRASKKVSGVSSLLPTASRSWNSEFCSSLTFGGAYHLDMNNKKQNKGRPAASSPGPPHYLFNICTYLHSLASLIVHWMASSKNAPNNTRGLFALRTCYIMHGMLVMIHIVLVFFYVYESLEHHVTLCSTKYNDFWSVVLSASLQAFYTIYTAVLLFLTQRLAISRTLVRRVKLTAVHDISGAWAGLGSALSSVWRQTDIPASWWTTSAVAVYLASISVLHVTSSVLLQFQALGSDNFMTTLVPTTLGWLDDSSYGNFVDLGPIAPSLPVVNHLTGLASAGLSNTTLYDTFTMGTPGTAFVNTTTVTSSCGLIPNVTYSADTSTAIFQFGDSFALNTSISSLWADQIHIIPWTEYEDSDGDLDDSEFDGIYLMVSTSLGIDPLVQDEVAVNMTWAIPGAVTSYAIQISKALATSNYSSGMIFEGSNSQIIELSIMDQYIMSLVGLNLTQEYIQFRDDGALPISNFTLRPDELEFAVARAAAQLIWLAGRLGTANGGIDPGSGSTYVDSSISYTCLNINFLPLAFATSASVIMLGLALHMTRAFDASHDSQAAIPDIGVLQLLWLGHRSVSINQALQYVQHPTEAILRRAGMTDICLAKKLSNEEEFGSSIASDSLSCGVDRCHDDDVIWV
ncbi:uncharacterized protein EDB93DRAFT_1104674 [Suillus bovinus]|uniref:uncharacterized protein n=1 Tax=Suillus bovinus TaxID=48563 RepID=UPI001B886977|nr:uncharacterized protein EDB93DRAFT_1104674 [Suillus bovinus]KAG2145422.1 hypothetical protein EDB93DRAFT_1104674 [Suillus bovinus]